MAGEAKTSQVLLSTATLMVGPSAEVMSLTPQDHGLGLVKNVRVQTDMGYTDLTQGVTNQIIASVQTKMDVKIMAEVYEYTNRNLAYGAGLDASLFPDTPPVAPLHLGASIAGPGSSLSLAAGTGATSTIVLGDFLCVSDENFPDNVFVTKVLSLAADVVTLDPAWEIPAGAAFPVATTVIYHVAKPVVVGNNFHQPTFGAKIVGIFPDSGKRITMIYPKVKITKGLDLSFETNNFSNMPFEFTPYVPVSTDPLYADFMNKYYMILQ